MAIVGLAALVFLIGAGFYFVSSRESTSRLKASIKQERTNLISRIVERERVRILAVASDYTTWDEAASFVAKPNPEWGNENIDYGRVQHRFSGIVVFDPEGNVAYETFDKTESRRPVLKSIVDPKKLIKADDTLRHWFQLVDGQVVECVAGTIHKAKDSGRTGKRHGSMIFAKVWDEQTMADLKKISGADVYVHFGDGVLSLAGSQAASKPKPHEISSFLTLTGSNGQPVAQVEFRSESRAIAMINQTSQESAAVVVIFVSGLIGLLSVALQIWVARPMNMIQVGLRDGDDSRIARLIKDPTEFGRIAELIIAFNDQKHKLEEANVDLSESMNELARMNFHLDSMVQERTKELYEAYEATIEGWSRAMEVRDQETEGHCRRVTQMSMLLGKLMNLDPTSTVRLKRGALLHDIGKMGIPDGILLKPGRLTPEERLIMEQHPIIAYEMLKPIRFLADCLDVPLYHHEKWDGTGYPYGLKGEVIPLNARIFAVADVWDAMRSDRPYRQAWDEQKTRDFIIELSGTHFDPQVVEAYLAIGVDELERLRRPEVADVANVPKAA